MAAVAHSPSRRGSRIDSFLMLHDLCHGRWWLQGATAVLQEAVLDTIGQPTKSCCLSSDAFELRACCRHGFQKGPRGFGDCPFDRSKLSLRLRWQSAGDSAQCSADGLHFPITARIALSAPCVFLLPVAIFTTMVNCCMLRVVWRTDPNDIPRFCTGQPKPFASCAVALRTHRLRHDAIPSCLLCCFTTLLLCLQPVEMISLPIASGI